MKIAIYTDDAPIAEDRLASGMNRVNTRLFNAINENITTIVTSFQHRDFDNTDLDFLLFEKIRYFSFNKLTIKLIRKLNKLFSKVFSYSFDFLFYLSKKDIIDNLIDSNSDILFVPLGSNIRAYSRAIHLSKETNLPLAVYIVDEFLDAAILAGDKYGKRTCEKYLQQYLEYTKTIFVISEGMQEYLKTNYNVKSIVLNLPFEKKFDISENTINQILFLGNLSHFYEDGILELLKSLRKFNSLNSNKIVLRLTIKTLPSFLNGFEDLIVYSKIDGDDNLAKEINKSLFCFIPYSFDKKYKTMVSTSFPSKTLECLSYAKHILVYGPSYCSAVRYFDLNNIKTTIDTQDENLIFTFINKIVNDKINYSIECNNIVTDNHSYDSIKTTFLGTIYE